MFRARKAATDPEWRQRELQRLLRWLQSKVNAPKEGRESEQVGTSQD